MSSTHDEEASLLVSYQLMSDDLDAMRAVQKGESKETDPLTDDEEALVLQILEIELASLSLGDSMMAQSLDNALRTDSTLLGTFQDLQRFEDQDRRAALALSRGEQLPGNDIPFPDLAASVVEIPEQDDDSSSEDEQQEDLKAEASTISARVIRLSTGRSQTECVACMRRIRGPAIQLPCGDAFDRKCLREFYEQIIRDQSLFPPRCCRQEIPVGVVRNYLGSDLLVGFMRKAYEYKTLNPLYCVQPSCSRFLGPASDDSISRKNVACPDCLTATCSLCKAEAHPATEICPSDPSDTVLIQLADENHWRRCPSCQRMVELAHGCNHITCLCRAQFCYVCGAAWKSCTCDLFDEAPLLAAAAVDVQARHAGEARRAPEAQIAQEVQARVEYLRVNHDCQHLNWQWRHGGGQCQFCYDFLPRFLFRCNGCATMACRRCQRNRL